jgi:hypothetical protein
MRLSPSLGVTPAGLQEQVSFSCDLGLHEGDDISPTLYLYFIDDLLHEVHAKHSGITLMGPCVT